MSTISRLALTALLAILFVFPQDVSAQAAKDELRHQLSEIAKSTDATIGVAMSVIEAGDTLSMNGSRHLPMQSVYKFPLALAVLNRVDKGKLSLDTVLHLGKRDLLEETWSPLREKYPSRKADVPLREVLRCMVSESDNNACDILFRLMGGPGVVNQYIHSLGVRGITIAYTEAQMHADWHAQFTNWCEPRAMRTLLESFYKREHLSQTSSDLLLKMMTETTTGPNRIRNLLPAGTIVANKTGTSGYSEGHHITAAVNDIGIITLPNGKHLAIVVYVSMSKEKVEPMERIIARVAKAAWDWALAK